MDPNVRVFVRRKIYLKRERYFDNTVKKEKKHKSTNKGILYTKIINKFIN